MGSLSWYEKLLDNGVVRAVESFIYYDPWCEGVDVGGVDDDDENKDDAVVAPPALTPTQEVRRSDAVQRIARKYGGDLGRYRADKMKLRSL